MCRPTGIMKHVISYYNYNSTNVNVYKLDTTKVFDRVHYGQLFRILQKINLPAIMLRLLLDMYTRQSTAPILFCVYIDELFSRIRKSGYGCYIGHLSYAAFGYADDVKLISLTIGGLEKLLEICELFLREC